MAHDAFISYSAKDKTVADAACAVLEGRGIRCWIAPRDVTPGMDWGAEIIDAINEARVMVLVYSSNANGSDQIKREVERGVHKGMPIVPFRIEDVPMSKSLEYFISSQHWLDALTPPLEQHLEYLARTIALLLSRPGPGGPTVTATAGAAGAGAIGAAGAAALRPNAPSAAAPPHADEAPAFAPAVAGGAPTGGAPTGVGAGTVAASPSKPRISRRMVWWIAAGVFFAIGAVNLYMRSGVDRPLVGTWVLTKDDRAGHWLSTFTIAGNGDYRTEIAVHEIGTMTVGNGQFRMASTNQVVTQGTYTAVSPTTVRITTQLGTVEWTRKPGTAPPPAGKPFAGVWDATRVMNGAPVHQEIETREDGGYQLVSTTVDEGQMKADEGRWQMKSNAGPTIAGTYRLTDPRTLNFTGPFGTSIWTRQ